MSNSSINWANFATIARVILAFITYALLLCKHQTDFYCYIGFVLTVLVIAGDYLDGQLARALKQSSVFGGWLDIAADRVVEICYWIVFAHLHWISPWIAIIFVVRGILVDGIRSFAAEKGFTAFGDKTMMNSKIGKFLVSSRFSRVSYAVLKAMAFSLVILSQCHSNLSLIAQICVSGATVFCLIRGIPVLIESARFIKD